MAIDKITMNIIKLSQERTGEWILGWLSLSIVVLMAGLGATVYYHTGLWRIEFIFMVMATGFVGGIGMQSFWRVLKIRDRIEELEARNIMTEFVTKQNNPMLTHSQWRYERMFMDTVLELFSVRRSRQEDSILSVGLHTIFDQAYDMLIQRKIFSLADGYFYLRTKLYLSMTNGSFEGSSADSWRWLQVPRTWVNAERILTSYSMIIDHHVPANKSEDFGPNEPIQPTFDDNPSGAEDQSIGTRAEFESKPQD